MSSIMMDRWSIESIVNYLKGDSYKRKEPHNYLEDRRIEGDDYDYEFYQDEADVQCWYNFLTAIILWDEIWSLHQENMYDWNKIFDNQNIAKNFGKSIYQLKRDEIDESLIDVYSMLSGNLNEYFQRSIYERTLGYQMLSNLLGVPFLAHPSRREHFICRRTFDFFERTSKSRFTRKDILKKIDRELMQYYEQINNELGRELLSFNYPVLIDYIRKDTQTSEEELEKALELRMDNDAVSFRNQVFDIEQTIKTGNTQLILSELKLISDLAKDITNKYQKRFYIGEFNISLSPSLSVPVNFSKNRKHDLHATFIRKLLNFGVYERV